MVNAATMNERSDLHPTGLSRKLLFETLKEMEIEAEPKDFSKKSNRWELKTFGRGVAGEVLSLVNMAVLIILIMIVIGVISMIF